MQQELNLNERAMQLCDRLAAQAEQCGVAVTPCDSGARIIDCGVNCPGSQQAGIMLARICLADLAQVEVVPAEPWPQVNVDVEHPVAACMASQYAGWEVKGGSFFAMGSGPMRAAAGRELLFEDIDYRESPSVCVGVLETSELPPPQVCQDIATKCGVEPSNLTLLVARTSSIAGTLQVVARSVETALHKLHELGFDLSRIERGQGTAPLPPVAGDDFVAIGVTNDAVLYGGEVTLLVRGDDASLAEIGPQVPSSASRDYGRPFAEVLARYNNNFYEVDPLLFSPAAVEFQNLDTGATHHFGKVDAAVIEKSFGAS